MQKPWRNLALIESFRPQPILDKRQVADAVSRVTYAIIKIILGLITNVDLELICNKILQIFTSSDVSLKNEILLRVLYLGPFCQKFISFRVSWPDYVISLICNIFFFLYYDIVLSDFVYE